MMLGKRPRQRPPMKRNSSMTEFSYDDLSVVVPSDSNQSSSTTTTTTAATNHSKATASGYASQAPSRSLNRRNSGDFVLEANGTFLRTCSLCHRRLAPTRDIYMYRGDSAFCSLECRQQQMTQDEWKEKKSISSNKKESNSSTPTHVPSSKGEKIVAL